MLSKEEAIKAIATQEMYLRRRLESVNPEEAIARGIALMEDVARDPTRSRLTVPAFAMIQFIEASCAYFKRWKYRPVSDQDIREIVGKIAGFSHPSLEHLLRADSGIVPFLRIMHRQQIDKQVRPNRILVTRGSLIARCGGVDGIAMSSLADLTVREWAAMTFLVHSAGRANKWLVPDRAIDDIKKSSSSSQHLMSRFLDHVTIEVENIGEEYRKRSLSLEGLQERSPLYSRPVVRSARGFAIPSESLFIQLFDEELARRILCETSVASRFRDGFAKYVEAVFVSCFGRSGVVLECDLRRYTSNKCADIVVKLSDCLVIVECKGVRYDRRLVTDSAFQQSSALARVRDGVVQVESTAKDIRQGRFRELQIKSDLPCFGYVAVLGQIPTVNADRKVDSGNVEASVLEFEPQVLHGVSVELAALALEFAESPAELIRGKRDAAGLLDWDIYFSSKIDTERASKCKIWENALLEIVEV